MKNSNWFVDFILKKSAFLTEGNTMIYAVFINGIFDVSKIYMLFEMG